MGIRFPQGGDMPSDQELLSTEAPIQVQDEYSFMDRVADMGSLRPSEKGMRAMKAAGAVVDQAWEDTAVGIWARKSALSELESYGGKQITPEEANKLYPEMTTPFDKPLTPLVADYLANNDFERRERARIIAEGPQGLGTDVTNFGLGMLTHLMDPLETGTMLIGGAAFGAVAKAGTLGKGLQGLATAESLSLGESVALSVAEATTADLAQNIGLEVATAVQVENEQGNYDIAQGAANVALGTLAGPILGTLHGIGKAGFRSAESAIARRLEKDILQTSPAAAKEIERVVMSDIASGRDPDVSPILESLAMETSVKEVPGKLKYEYTPIKGVVPEGKKFYIAADSADLPNAKRFYTSDGLGRGTHVTDNPGVANVTAGRSLDEGAGVVHEINLDGAKVLDLDEKVLPGSAEHEVFTRALRETGDPNPEATLSEMTPRQIVERFDDFPETTSAKAFDAYENGLREAGFDAVKTSGESRMGFEGHEPHNAMMILNEERVKSNGAFTPDPEVRNGISAQVRERALQYREDPTRNRFDMDADVAAKRMEGIETISLETAQRVQTARAEAEVLLEELTMLEGQGNLPASMKQTLEQIRELQAAEKDTDFLVKAATFCVRA